MIETANVVKIIDSNLVKVELERTSACKDCKICKADIPFEITAVNEKGAKVGDKVLIEIEHFKKSLPFFVYILPIFIIIGGYAIGFFISKLINIKNSENFSIIISAVFFTLYILKAAYKLKKGNKVVSRITKIIY